MTLQRQYAILLGLILTVVSLVSFGFAQSDTATLSGQITDPAGRVIPEVEVAITNQATNVCIHLVTNEAGLYVATGLTPGRYRVSVTKPSFRQVNLTDLVLNVQDTLSRNFQLQLGPSETSITVVADNNKVDTESAAIGTVIDRNFVSNLPLNGRSFQTLILLSPGVVPTGATNGPGDFSVNGQRTNTNYFTVDGVSANTGISSVLATGTNGVSQSAGGAIPGNTALGTTSSLVPVDALEEFRIQTSTYSAEFGRQPGGQVQLVTRSGGDQFHGTAFEFLRNDVLDAQDWFNSQLKARNPNFRKPALRMNDFGGTFSGPIVKDKTFFFFSYEGMRLRLPITSSQLEFVPTAALRNSAAPALKPFLDAIPLPNGPEVQVLEQPQKPYDPNPSSPTYNPLEASGFASLSGGYSNPSSVDTYSLRLDQSLGGKLKLFGRYSRSPSNNLARLSMNNPAGVISNNRTVTIGANLAITNRLADEFRANYSSNNAEAGSMVDSSGGATPITVNQMTAPYNGPGPRDSEFSLGVGQWFTGNTPFYFTGDTASNRQHQWDLVDNLSWIKGRHALRGGIDWRHLTPVYGPTAYRELINLLPPLYYSQFLNMVQTGSGVSVTITANKQVKPIYDDLSLYVDDSWKITSRLTLTPGLRWEINPAPHDANGVTPIMITNIQATDVSGATLAPAGSSFYKTDYKAFAPRIGAAYQLRRSNGWETVLRGGFGVFYDLGSEQALNGFATYPFSSTTTLSNITLPLSSSQAQQPPFPADPSSVTLPLHRGILYAVNPNLTLPYTLQWNVGIEQALGSHQVVTVSYVGSGGRKLMSTYSLNNIPTTAPRVANQNPYRANPNLDTIRYSANTSTSNYDSFQAQYQRRLSRGLQALANYTWSHAIDDLSYSGLGVIGVFARGNSDFDVRHNLSVALTYETPSISRTGKSLAGRISSIASSGWSVNTILLAHSGLPLDVTSGIENLDNGMFATIRPNVIPGQPVWISDPGAPGGQQLNVNAFTYPAYTVVYPYPTCPTCPVTFYQQGDLGRNSVRVPGIYQLNMGIGRQIGLSERVKAQLKIEAFNVFNHPLFGAYSSGWTPTASLFGVPSQMLSTANAGNVNAGSTALGSLFQNGGPRSLQVSLKLNF